MQSEPEKMLAERLGGKFEEKIDGKIAEFGGLLTRKAAVLLLCRQHGIEAERRVALAHAGKEPLPFSFRAKVDRIFPVQEYQGGAGRSVRLHVSDASQQATLVLWNEQAAQVEAGEILAGDELECTGAIFRSGEICIGRGGSIVRAGGRQATMVSKLTHGICHAQGVVGEIEPDYHYVDRKTGEKKALSSFMLCEGRVCRRVVVWPGQPGAPRPEEGEHLVLENVVFKNGELHFNAYSRAIRKEAAGEAKGRLQRVSSSGGNAVFDIDGRSFSLLMPEALSLVGIRTVPDGVEPSTILGIKAAGLKGKDVRYRVQGGKLFWLSLGK